MEFCILRRREQVDRVMTPKLFQMTEDMVGEALIARIQGKTRLKIRLPILVSWKVDRLSCQVVFLTDVVDLIRQSREVPLPATHAPKVKHCA
jgi:hypothetical protein